MSTPERKVLSKPSTFDELYAGRFLKAGLLGDRKVTLRIRDVELEELQDDDGTPKAKAVLSFERTERQLVACKTNGLCLKAMFGADVRAWVGKSVTLYSHPNVFRGEPGIRVWGSPDIAADFDVQIKLPKKKPFSMTMHRVELQRRAGAEAGASP